MDQSAVPSDRPHSTSAHDLSPDVASDTPGAERRALSFSPLLPLLIATVTATFTLLSVFSATAQNGLPSNSATDRTLPAFRLAPNTRQPDFQMPELPAGRLVNPNPPRVVRPAPVLPNIGSTNCPQVFAPVCGRIGNVATTFSSSCSRRAAGAVAVPDSQCRGG
jgi:hypothetical protein